MEDQYTFYLGMRKLANDNVVRSATSLDHIIFVAVTGALVLGSGLIEKFQNPDLYTSICIFLSVVTLLGALFFHSRSYQKSIDYNKTVVQKLDTWIKEARQFGDNSIIPFSLPTPNVTIDDNGRSRLDNCSFYLMWIGIIALTVSIFLSIFKI